MDAYCNDTASYKLLNLLNLDLKHCRTYVNRLIVLQYSQNDNQLNQLVSVAQLMQCT